MSTFKKIPREDGAFHLQAAQRLVLCSSEIWSLATIKDSSLTTAPAQPSLWTVWPFLIILCFVSPLHLLLLSSESESFCGFPWHPHRCPPSAQHLAFCVRISCAFVSLQLKAISQLGVLAHSGESQALSSLQTDVRKRSKVFALPDSGFRPPLSLY